MDGVTLNKYLARRLAEEGLTIETNRVNELYDYLTEGRDEVLKELAKLAPTVVQSTVELVADAVAPDYKIPDASLDPIAVIQLREKTSGRPLDPSRALNQDGGDFQWKSLRKLRLRTGYAPGGGVELLYVPGAVDIAAATTEAEVGLPTPCHRAAAKFAAVLALTADEESDATNAMGLYQREMARVLELYHQYAVRVKHRRRRAEAASS